ncbi:MAG TPA: UvrB/UvrC motif-containing protein [Chthoniobacterales bacterium]
MNLDLDNLLQDWPHEPGQIKVRKILGNDNKEKLQLRIDLGVIQMEVDGRPDGVRPHGCESLLAWHQKKARKVENGGEIYTLTADDCGALQQESIQYYHRYISLFQISDFQNVIRDTQRNLDLVSFVSRCAESEEIRWSFEQFRPYVVMMNTRARAAIKLQKKDFSGALKEIAKGRALIVNLFEENDQGESVSKSPEIGFLDEWAEEIRKKKPISKLEVMQREMEQAISVEAYERAAELRDKIRAFGKKTAKKS